MINNIRDCLCFLTGVVFVFSCATPSPQKTTPATSPKVVALKGYVVPSDSINTPLIIPTISETVPIGKTDSIKIDGDWDMNVGNIFSYFNNKIGKEDCLTKIIGGVDALYNPKSIVEDKKGNLWFASIGGISCYDGNGITYFTDANFSEEQGFCYNVINDILEDKKGDLWFSTGNGRINKYDGKKFAGFKTDGQGFLSSFEDRTGILWFCNFGGLYKYDGKTITHFTNIKGAEEILQDKVGKIWLATQVSGIANYDGKIFTLFTEKEGFNNNKVWSMRKDQSGNLWFGTMGSGAVFYNGKTFTTFTKIQGLANDTVNSICQDKKGNIWFGTNNGLSEMSAENLRLLEHNNYSDSLHAPWFRNFNTKDGFNGGSFLANSVCEDKNGNIWWGTSNGLLIYHPDRDKDNDLPVVAQQSNWWEKWWFWTSVGILIFGSVNGYFRYKMKTRKLK